MRVDGRPPLNTIWLKDIENVQKANVKTQNTKRVNGASSGYVYQFEITVKGDIEYDAFEEGSAQKKKVQSKVHEISQNYQELNDSTNHFDQSHLAVPRGSLGTKRKLSNTNMKRLVGDLKNVENAFKPQQPEDNLGDRLKRGI